MSLTNRKKRMPRWQWQKKMMSRPFRKKMSLTNRKKRMPRWQWQKKMMSLTFREKMMLLQKQMSLTNRKKRMPRWQWQKKTMSLPKTPTISLWRDCIARIADDDLPDDEATWPQQHAVTAFSCGACADFAAVLRLQLPAQTTNF